MGSQGISRHDYGPCIFQTDPIRPDSHGAMDEPVTAGAKKCEVCRLRLPLTRLSQQHHTSNLANRPSSLFHEPMLSGNFEETLIWEQNHF